MKIRACKYKGVAALELTTSQSKAILLHSEGGKLASFQDIRGKKEYLLQNPSDTFLRTGPDDDFEKCECAGFDDMFPTIDPVSVTYSDGVTLHYQDHGEVCRMPFLYEKNESSVKLRYRSKELGYEYEKRFSEDARGELVINYTIHNASARDLEVLWAGHCLINAEAGGQILVPFEEGEPADIMEDTTREFVVGERVQLRSDMLKSVWNEDEGVCRKFYFARSASEGFISYRYPAGDTLVMEFDKQHLQYIGIWINYGYLNGAYCIGLEPASAGYDTVANAKNHGHNCTLKKGESKNFFVKLSIK